MSHKRVKKDIKKKAGSKIDFSKQLTNFEELYKVPLLTNFELEQFKELLKLSNNAGAVMKDISEKEIMVIKMKEIVRRIESGEIKPPLWQQLFPGRITGDTTAGTITGITLAQFNDMKSAVKMLNDNIKAVADAVELGKGQLGHRYEEYVDAHIRMRDRLTKNIGEATIKRISPHRIGAAVDEHETKVFDGGFDEFVKKEEETLKKR